MSRIALDANASGTGVFTIASPNSDTDRTLNLPDKAGTVNVGEGIDDNATSTAITIDASQNVGIGTDSPANILNLNGNTEAGHDLAINRNTTYGTNTGMGGVSWYNQAGSTVLARINAGTNGNATSSRISFDVSSSGVKSEAMRLDSTGGLRIGKNTNIFNYAASERLSVKNTVVGCAATFESTNVTGGYPVIYVYSSDPTSGAQNAITFYRTSGIVGGIGTTNTSTSYNTSSDYRLKENVVTLDNATDRLKQIPVHRFNFIADPDATVDGFIAHEVQAVVPEAVTGSKDEVNDEGNPVYQGIDQSKLVPLLTAALQEAVAKIEDLESRLSALENN